MYQKYLLPRLVSVLIIEAEESQVGFVPFKKSLCAVMLAVAEVVVAEVAARRQNLILLGRFGSVMTVL